MPTVSVLTSPPCSFDASGRALPLTPEEIDQRAALALQALDSLEDMGDEAEQRETFAYLTRTAGGWGPSSELGASRLGSENGPQPTAAKSRGFSNRLATAGVREIIEPDSAKAFGKAESNGEERKEAQAETWANAQRNLRLLWRSRSNGE